MKILYAGTPEFAVPALEALLDAGHEVCAVLTQPDRPAGRGQKLQQSPVKQLALARGIPVLQPQTLRDAAIQAELHARGPDLMVVAAYGLILPQAVLDIPTHGCINIHASLLPRWRGAAPIQRAILAGDATTGITIMQMALGLDTGDMLLRREMPIAPEDTAGSLHDKLAALGADCLLEALRRLERGELVPEPQDDTRATYAEKLRKDEAEIDWTQPAEHILRQIRAFNPWPVAFTACSQGVLRVWGAQAGEVDAHGEAPGQVLAESRERGVLVQTGTAPIWLTRLQLPGGRPLAADAFLNGRSLAGERLGRR